nr:hypothetical protein CFP56_61912 [Quercus suber]
MISPPLVLWCADCTIEREDINDDLLERILITPTPSNYRVGIRPLHFQFHCSSSPLSTSSASDASEGLTSRLLELLGFSSLQINLSSPKEDNIQCGLLQSSKYCKQEHLGGNLPLIDNTQCGRNLKV